MNAPQAPHHSPRSSLRAHHLNRWLRVALFGAHVSAFLLGFIRIHDGSIRDSAMMILLTSALALLLTLTAMYSNMLVDIIDSLWLIYTSRRAEPGRDEPSAPHVERAALRSASAYKPLRALLLLCCVVGALTTFPLPPLIISTTALTLTALYLLMRAVIDGADALLLIQSRRLHAANP